MSAFSAIAGSAAAWPEDQPLPTLPAKLPEGARARPAHKDAARQIAWALAQNTGGDWLACGAALRLLRNAQEAFGLAMAALGAIEERDMPKLLEEALSPSGLAPLAAALDACEPHKAWAIAAARLEGLDADRPDDPPFWAWQMNPVSVMEHAMLWARDATEFQRRSYAMAALAHMSEEDRHAIVRSLDSRGAA